MATFVLVHGGGHGGWCWRACANELRARGHEVYAPTLTGFGDRSHLLAPDFETFVTDIANVIAFEDLDDVVLVGHSMGGVIIPRVAEAMPDRMRRLIWLAAVVTSDGESLLQATPQSEWIARAVTIGDDGTAQITVMIGTWVGTLRFDHGYPKAMPLRILRVISCRCQHISPPVWGHTHRKRMPPQCATHVDIDNFRCL